MAPPPSPDLPLSEKLRTLAQTLQFAWFIGHVTLLLSVTRYFLSYVTFRYYSTSAQIAYRLGFLAAAATYGIVVYKQYIARGLPQGGARGLVGRLATDENVQYLGMALLWLNSRQVPLALLPFTVYSVFHVATYTKSYLIPTFQPAKPGPPQHAPSPSNSSNFPGSPKPAAPKSPLAEVIGRFIRQYYDASMGLVATLELLLLFRLVLSALSFSKGSWVLLFAYLSFFRARYAQSSFVQQSVRHITARIDTLVAHQSTPPQVRQGWGTFKGLVRQGYETLDGGRAAAASSKKPQ